MGRPKKTRESVEARERLIHAFWDALETSRYSELTVSSLSARAGCTRGTFYYHFTDLDDLTFAAIEMELTGPNSIINDIFCLITDANNELMERMLDGKRVKRFSLIIRKCGSKDKMEELVIKALYGIWQAVLCTDGAQLRPDARYVIDYSAGGMLKLLSSGHLNDLDSAGQKRLIAFASEAAAFTLSKISQAYDLTLEEILARLKMFNQMMQYRDTQYREAAPL